MTTLHPQKRILLMDNVDSFLATYAKLLELEGYKVFPATTLEAAEKILASEHVHLAIFDIRMLDENNPADKSGLELANRKEYKHIPKIILTAYPSFEDVRIALGSLVDGLPAAVEFLKKEDAAEILIPTVKQAFQEKVKLNWELEFQFRDEIQSFSQLATLIEPELNPEQMGGRTGELEDIFRRIFINYKFVTLARKFWQFDGLVALEVSGYRKPLKTGTNITTYREEQFILSIGKQAEASAERRNFLDLFPQAYPYIEIGAQVDIFHYGGTAWIYRDIDIEACTTLDRYLRHEKTDKQIKSTFEDLYKNKLSGLQAQLKEYMAIDSLTQCFQEISPAEDKITPENWGQWFGNLVTDALARNLAEVTVGAHKITYSLGKNAKVAFTDPAEYLFNQPLPPGLKILKGVTLGGVRAETILVDGLDRAHLSNFRGMRSAPLYLDFISLESNIRFDILESTNIISIHQLEAHLLSTNSLRDSLSPGAVESDCKRALLAIQVIRQMAADVCGEDLMPYFLSLLSYTILSVGIAKHYPGRSKREITIALHRLMLIGMLCEKLFGSTKDNRQQKSLASRAGISISSEEHRVVVDGRQIELTPTEFGLLFYLYQHAGRLCTREALIQDVLGIQDTEGDSEKSLLNTHISRLRQKIEVDTNNPKYLHTVRGKGYKIILPK